MALYNNTVYPTGAATLFQQSSAPTGWTKNTSINDYAIRVSAGAGGTTGGSTRGFSTWATSRSVTTSGFAVAEAYLPAHTHSTYQDDGSNSGEAFWNNTTRGTTVTTGGATGSSGAWPATAGTHTHATTVDLTVAYVDVIIATKD